MQPLRIAFAVSVLLAAAPFTAKAQVSHRIERSVEEIDDLVENPCNGEMVQITGTISVTTRVTLDPNGVTHLASNTVSHLSGVGPSGEYSVLDQHHVRDIFVNGEDVPENIHGADVYHLVGKGKTPDFRVTINHRFVVDADGRVKVDFFRDSVTCTGKV